MTARGRVARRLERALIGAVMNVITFIIERRVLKVIRRAGKEQLRPARKNGFASGG